jgi:hypothetical protein
MGWQLAPDVSFAVASGRTIFLDLARDRYSALSLAQSDDFQRWIAQPDDLPLPPVGERLLQAGLLISANGPSAISAAAITRPRTALASRPGSPALAAAWDVALSSARVRWSLRRRGLAATLARPGVAIAGNSAERTRDLAAAFVDIRRHLPSRGSCLPDSLALLDFLRRRGAGASIVFGVTGTPFRAHCWLQLGEEVLNDALDNVAPFTPILSR